MAVTATILPGGDTEITEELLRNELKTRGITGGINDIAIREMAEYGVYKDRIWLQMDCLQRAVQRDGMKFSLIKM